MTDTDDQKLVRRGIVLSEEQWRLVKSHAAKRGQTISEWFQTVVTEGGLGQSKIARYPEAKTTEPLHAVRVSPNGDIEDPVKDRRFTPAPKPGGKKTRG